MEVSYQMRNLTAGGAGSGGQVITIRTHGSFLESLKEGRADCVSLLI